MSLINCIYAGSPSSFVFLISNVGADDDAETILTSPVNVEFPVTPKAPVRLAPTVLVLTVNTAVPSAFDTSNAFASSEPGIISILFVATFIPIATLESPSVIATKVFPFKPPSGNANSCS